MAHPAPSTSASATESDQKKEREDSKTKKKEGKKTGFYRIELRKSHSYTSQFATLANI